MKFENLDLLVARDIKHNNVPMLIGEPGIGKSSWVESFTRETLNTCCFILPCNQLADKADLTGCRLVPIGKNKAGEDDYAQVFYPHIVIRNAIEYAENHPTETPVLFLDEINRTTPDVTSEALSIPTLRSIGNRRIPDNLKVIIAGNDKGNVVALDKASITRFVMYHIEPDISTFIAVNKNLNPYVVNVLKKNPSYIYMDAVTISADASGNDDDNNADFEIEMDDGLEQTTTPRTITATSRWLNEFSYDELMSMLNTSTGPESNLLMEALIAHAGNTAFTMALMDEILNANITAQNGNTVTVTEPASYQLCQNAHSRDELTDIITGLNNADRSELLLYSIYDSRNNTNLLNVLAPMMTQIEPSVMQKIITLSQNHALDRNNFDILVNINCQPAQFIKMLNL